METLYVKNKQRISLILANPNCAIFLIGVLGLYLEMLIIRWISTEVRIFAYLQNAVLVVCFLGLGLGCFTSKQPIIFRDLLLPLSCLVLLLSMPTTKIFSICISQCLSLSEDLVIWSPGFLYQSPWQSLLLFSIGLALTYFMMVFILDIFVPIGRLLGRLMDDHPKTILAYSFNIAGSLVGIWIFFLLSAFYQPPLIWFVVLGCLMLFFLIKSNQATKLNLVLIVGIIFFSWFATFQEDSLEIIWSPYQKLVTSKTKQGIIGKIGKIGKYLIEVNNTDYQEMIDLSEANIRSDPQRYPPELMNLSQYDIPLLLHPDPKSYLIVGAGSGNDAAGGIRHGIKRITAVEIDPVIISLGHRYHPENPYSSPYVEIINDDARSYFATCQKKYDIIAFGLLDAHTATMMHNARLDHYVYTKESITKVKSLLSDGGIIVLNFLATKDFIADRMAKVIGEVFAEEPIVFFWLSPKLK